jgi:uncharacterized membrane protein
MNITLLILRVAHVVGAVFWAGSILFVVDFLQPALRDAGPDGMKVLVALRRRRYFVALPVFALLTVASGFALYYRVFHRFHPGPGAGGAEMTYAIGGLASVVALIIGLAVMRPSVVRLADLSAEWRAAPAERRTALDAEIGALRARGKLAGRLVVIALTVAMVTMAIARYL